MTETDNKKQSGQPIARRDFLRMASMIGGTALAWNASALLSKAAGANKSKAELTPKALKNKPAQAVKPCLYAAGAASYDASKTIEPKTFENLKTVNGISQNQLNQHIGLYQGYVKKINEIQTQINASVIDQASMNATYNPYRELHVEQTFALNGAVLHEYYFENIGGNKTQPSSTLKTLLTKEFGGWDQYVNHLSALGKSARGWVMTAYNMRDHRIHNYLMDAHNQLTPFYVMPILVMDVYEHAYMIDFGTKRPAYLEAFLANIDWQVIENRLDTMLWHTDKHKKA